MDIETEKVIELLFPDGIPESWKENSEFYQYLAKIGEYDAERLNKEPDRLVEEQTAVQQNIQDLILSNYKTFIRTAENSQEIFKEFNQTEAKLDGLLEKIPNFIEKCKGFCNSSKEINTHRKLNGLILSKSADLLEILELPQLMESCLRNNEYSEALELSQYAKYINGKYGDIPIILNIVNEIENSWSVMINQVVDSLKEDLSLPKCLQLIGLLRSMDVFTESELRIKFIQARENWLQTLLKSISKENPNIHLTKTIELSRIHLFNTITQYKAIFNDCLTFDRNADVNDSAIFYEWLEEKISQFLTTLEQDLPFINSIETILGQCTYFGLSFGRVGGDFTGGISNVFVKIIDAKIKSNLSKFTKKFETNLESFTFPGQSRKSSIKCELVINSEIPPEQLIEYFPLAEYCNDLIGVFNELRSSTPIALVQSFTDSVQASLRALAKAISNFSKKRQQLGPADAANVAKLAECFCEQLVPYLQYCIHALFPPVQIAAHFGVSVSQLQKEEISYLNSKLIAEPVESLLPVKSLPVNAYLREALTAEDSADLGSEAAGESSLELGAPEDALAREEMPVAERRADLSSDFRVD